MVLSCFVCTTKCLTVEGLLRHIKIRHSSADAYKCTTPSCVRSFKTFKSFRNHFLVKGSHPELSEKEPKPIACCNSTSDHTGGSLQSVSSNVINDSVCHVEVEEEQYNPDCSELRQDVTDAALTFVTKMYSSPCVSRTVVQDVVEGVTEFLTGQYMSFLQSKVLDTLVTNGAPDRDIVHIKSFFDAVSNPFEGLETDYLRLKALKETNMYVAPEPFTIGSEYKTKKIDGSSELVHCNVYGQHIPMKEVLNRFLELPGAMSAILDNLEMLNNNELFSNVVQGSLWKAKVMRHFSGKVVLPLLVYHNDYEPDNALGSHAGHHKISAVYYTIACLPPECLSVVENIFLATLFLAENKVFKGEKVFKRLIDDLIDLQKHGIEINGQRIYFCLCMLLGDNLGMHEMLGFVRGFRANYPCRLCRVHRNELQGMFRADPSLLRDSENYNADILLADVLKTGVTEKCAFNQIPSYGDPTQNPHCDLMHDVCEGAGKYCLGQVVHYIVEQKKYIDLITLNERVRNFDYSLIESSNVLPPITEEHLKLKKIKYSASEMLTCIRFFPLMIGDYVRLNDDVWDYFLTFREIVDIITAPYVNRQMVEYLRTLIAEHHEMYVTLFHETLKPKHHFLVHYPDLMLILGPLQNCSSMRWESNHRPAKQYAHTTNSRVHLPLTLASKHQMQQTYRFYSCKPILLSPVCGPSLACGVLLSACEDFSSFCQVLPTALREKYCVPVRWALVKGTKYERNNVVVLGYKREFPMFGVIKYIVPAGPDVHFIVSQLSTVAFNHHLYSFEVKETLKWKCMYQHKLVYHQPLKLSVAPQIGVKFVTTRFML